MSSLSTQRELMDLLGIVHRPLTTRQITQHMGFCWRTTRDNLEDLYDLGLVAKGKVKNSKRIFWKNAKHQ